MEEYSLLDDEGNKWLIDQPEEEDRRVQQWRCLIHSCIAYLFLLARNELLNYGLFCFCQIEDDFFIYGGRACICTNISVIVRKGK